MNDNYFECEVKFEKISTFETCSTFKKNINFEGIKGYLLYLNIRYYIYTYCLSLILSYIVINF